MYRKKRDFNIWNVDNRAPDPLRYSRKFIADTMGLIARLPKKQCMNGLNGLLNGDRDYMLHCLCVAVISNVRNLCSKLVCVALVNATSAGSGNLEITVTSRGEEIPSTVSTGMHASDVQVSFVPKYVDTHLVNVTFNGQSVPGYLLNLYSVIITWLPH